jgi:hypothetical protein
LAQGKDDEQVVKFMSLFASLQDAIGGDHAELMRVIGIDENVKSLCDDVTAAAYPLEMAERSQRRMFATPVDPAFVAAWREYESRYSSLLFQLWMADVLGAPIELDQDSQSGSGSKFESGWEAKASIAREKSDAIEAVFDFAER